MVVGKLVLIKWFACHFPRLIHHLLLPLYLLDLLSTLLQLFLQPGDIFFQLFASPVPGLPCSLVLFLLSLPLPACRLLHLQQLSPLPQTFLQATLTIDSRWRIISKQQYWFPSVCILSALINFAKQETYSPPLPYLVDAFCICYAHLQQFSPGYYQQHACTYFLSMRLLLKGHQILKRLWCTESKFGAPGAHFSLSIDIHKLILLGAGLG